MRQERRALSHGMGQVLPAHQSGSGMPRRYLPLVARSAQKPFPLSLGTCSSVLPRPASTLHRGDRTNPRTSRRVQRLARLLGMSASPVSEGFSEPHPHANDRPGPSDVGSRPATPHRPTTTFSAVRTMTPAEAHDSTMPGDETWTSTHQGRRAQPRCHPGDANTSRLAHSTIAASPDLRPLPFPSPQ